MANEEKKQSTEKQKASLNGLKKKDAVLPSKKTMNFVPSAKKMSAPALIITLILVFLVALVVAKFGFMDPIAKKNAAASELAATQASLAAVRAQIDKYGDLNAEYGRYSTSWMTDSELATVDRIAVLELLEEKVMSVAAVEDFSVNDNVMTMNIHGVTLERASNIVKQLESSPMVESASVYSASADDAVEASIFMSVTLQKEDTAE